MQNQNKGENDDATNPLDLMPDDLIDDRHRDQRPLKGETLDGDAVRLLGQMFNNKNK